MGGLCRKALRGSFVLEESIVCTRPGCRSAGRWRASLDYSQIDEIIAESLQIYVQGIRQQCEHVHTALYQTYINYETESAIAS